MRTNPHILWLPAWYPNTLAPYDGDFIQRHARAVSLFNKITVILIKKDEDALVTNNITEIVSSVDSLTEITVFYHPFKTGLRLLDKIISAIAYRKTYRKSLKKYVLQNGKPGLVHVHVALNAGVIALWLKNKYGIPYILSEHWSGYFKENKHGINQLNFLQKKWMRNIFANAAKLTVVSDALGKAIAGRFSNHDYEIIPNTVDTSVFFPGKNNINKTPGFIHISSLKDEKNPAQIIEAFDLIKKKGYTFHLAMYGPEKKDLQLLIKEKGLSGYINLKKEVPQKTLAEELKKADALVLFSYYETFGCVVIEANACGIPAILSDLPVFREYVYENVNGVFAQPGNVVNLAEKLEEFIMKKYPFNKTLIAENTAKKFGYPAIGKKFSELYAGIPGVSNLFNQ